MSDEPEQPSQVPGNVHIAECSGADDPEALARMMRSMHGPQAADHALRQAVSMCWMMLPDDKKNVEALEREVRRLIDRIIRDLREDADAFGASQSG